MMMKRGHVMNGSRRPFLTVGVVLFAAALLGAPHECGARVVREARLGMVADWPEQSVAAHASEFLRANVPTAFWEFVRNVEIDDDGAAAPLSAKAWASTNATLAKVVSPVQLRAAEVAVATRLYSPRLEYLHSAAMEILRAAGMDEKALPEVFLSADGVPIVQLEDLSRAFSSDFTDRTHLRLRNADIGVLSGPSLRYRQFVVFGRVGDQKTKEFLIQVQQELEKHGEVVGFCHFDAKRASRPQTTPIQGYGVSLTVKSTEYRVSNPEDSRTNVASSDDEAQTLRDREEDGVEGEEHRSFGFALPKLVSAAGKRIEELWKEKPAKAFVEQQNAIDDFTVDESNSAVSTAQFLSALSEEKEHKISRLISLLEHYPSQRKALLEQRVSERVEGRRFDSASVQDFDLNLETPFSTLQSLLSLSSAYNVMERFSSHSNQGDRIARLDIDPDGVLWLRNNENMKSASSDVEKIFHGGRVKHNVIDVVLVLNPFSVSDYDLVEQLFNRLSSYSGVRVGFVFTAHKNGDGKSTLDMQFSPRQESDGSDPVTLRQFLRALNAIWNAHKGEKRKMILAVLRAISDSNGELSHASLVQLYHEVAARGNAKVEVSNMAQVLLHEKHDALGDQFLRFCTEHNVVLLEKSNVVLVNGVATPLKNVDGVLQMELGAFRKHIDDEDEVDDAYLVRSFRAKRATGAKAIKLESSTSLQDYDRYFAAELASASLPRGKIGAGRFPLHCFGDVEDEMGRRMLLSCASAVTYGCNASVTFVPRCRDAKRCGGTASAIAEAVSAEQVINALASAPSPGSHVPTCNAPPSLCHSNAIVFAGRSVSLHGARCDHTARSPASCQLLYGSALAAMVNAEARTLEAAGAKDVQDALLYAQHAALLVARDKELPQAGDGALGEGDVSSPLRISAAVRLREPQTAWILPLLQRTASVLQARLDIDLYEGGNVNENVAKKVFRTFAFDPRVRFHSSGAMLRPRAILRALPQKTLFSADIDSPDRWVTSVRNATADMDNIVLESRPGDLRATYTLHAMAIEGTVTSTGCNFNGLELVTENHHTELHNITLAVDSYLARDEFVLIAPRKGQDAIFWDIQEKRAADESKAADEFIRSFFAMHPDAEHSLASLTRQDAGDSSGGNARTSSQDKINALLRTLFQSNDDASPNGESTGNEEASSDPSSASEAAQVAQTRPAVDPDTIHVFSVASGHLYERLLRIMILSVIKHTKRPVKFWFIRNFLSAQCMVLLSKMSTKYGFRYELVTYTWPVWLRKQTEKQRFIWAYKILFLDVLFPIDVKRIIFIDADQVVRTDMAELYDMDIGDNALAFTPFCNSNEETKGFRFWEGGYWAQILPRGKYHISALFMVDLEKFRLNGIGDSYRQTYQQLTGDPNSLANLDQDLPNYMQTTGVSIYSLPQEWLWCETWCSAESKAKAKTIDLCNNPLYKTHKLEMAKKIIPEWESYDDELKALELE